MASVPASLRTAARESAYKRGVALPPASKGEAPGFPITSAKQWDAARRAVGRVKDPARREALARLLRKTAPRFGRTAELKESWAAPAASQHASDAGGITLAETVKDDQGETLTCPECGHIAPAGHFGANGASLQRTPAVLRTPAASTAAVRRGVPLTVRANASQALSNTGSTRAAVELAAGTLRRPIHGPVDVLVKRAGDGTAVLKHRNGGAVIAALRQTPDGKWLATVNGRDLTPRDHQRTALMEAVGTWNSAIRGATRAQDAPLQPEPRQTPLMEQYGIPAVRSAGFATPVAGASDGPRVTTAGVDDSGSTDGNGLTPKQQGIYRKLLKKGLPPARALAFAKNAGKFRAAA